MRALPCVLGFALLVSTSVSAADPRWTMVRTDSLTVIGDQSASTLRDIAVQLEQFRVVVAGLIHNADRPPSLPTVVYVFGSKRAMQPYVPLVNGRPASIAGFFQRDSDMNAIVLSLEGFDESSSIAYHEYTHLLIGNAVRSVPVWLNEGLAEYYSTYRLAAGGREADVGRPPEGRLAVLRERSLPLADVIAVDHSSALYNESNKRSIFYAEAWALTHYVLTQTPNGGAAINRYAADIADGRTPYEAFANAFESSPAEFDKLLRVYVQRSLYAGMKFTFKDKLAVRAPSPAQILTAGETAAWLGDLQRRLGREVEAAPKIDAAVTAEPDAAVTHLAAGLLRLSQQRTGEGLAELERAAAIAPGDFFMQYLLGVWQLRADLAGSAEQSDSAATALERAIALKPESSEAYSWLAYAQMQQHETLREAQASIERAIALSPGRVDYRLRWADVRILQGEYNEARTLLTAIAAMRSDPHAADGANQRLESLNAFEERLRSKLRTVRPGEQRAAGYLTRIDCAGPEWQFQVAADGRMLVTTTSRVESIEVRSYVEMAPLLDCGPRAKPEAVYLTWIPDAAASAEHAGTIVALEFVLPWILSKK